MRCLVFRLPAASLGMVLLAASLATAQGVHLVSLSVGPIAIHDHISFNYHLHVLGSPYVDNMKQGYAFDGMDVGVGVDWIWNGVPLQTTARVSPGRRAHAAFDQDTALEPANRYTHGDSGTALGWTLGLRQQIPLTGNTALGRFSLDAGLLRQASLYNLVTTYDLNTDPALPSSSYQRPLRERAILYEIRWGVGWEHGWELGRWGLESGLVGRPASLVLLRNYIPVILAPTSTTAYGGEATLAISHALGDWRWRLRGLAGEETTYDAQQRFRRETFAVQLEFLSPIRH